MATGSEFLDVREAAAAVARTPETVRRWVWSGRLPAHRQGNRLLISRADLESVSGKPRLLSLEEWAAERERVIGSLPVTGATGADLVMEDRRQRLGD